MKGRKRDWYRAHQEYKAIYGSIPVDIHNRSYEIHHIDGNHDNNTIDNLIALSIDEHYEIHYWQGDKLACQAILMRMKISSEDISKIAREIAIERVENGTHPFSRRNDGSSLTSDRVKDGTNPWLTREDGTSVASDRVKDGSHNFLTRKDGSSITGDRTKAGKNPFSKREDGSSLTGERIKDGTYHLLGENHHSFDRTIYKFVHKNGVVEICMRSELIKKYDLDRVGVYKIIKNRSWSYKGWKCFE